MRDVVVLLSGGVDSAVVLSWAATPVNRLAGAVFVDYGQPVARQEWAAACRIAHHVGTECMKVTLAAEVALGDCMRIGVGLTGPRIVPGRNALLLSAGVSWAVQVGATEVWYGANADDARDYPDCRATFIRAFDAMSRTAYGVGVRAPLLTLYKGHIVRSATQRKLPLDLLWSCYESTTDEPCGRCNSCVARNEALLPVGEQRANAPLQTRPSVH